MSRSLLPSISETHAYTSRPYVASLSPASLNVYRTPVTSSNSTDDYNPRVNVRDTANIDVVTRPASRPIDRPIKREFTVGTLKRGRRVIRLQTSRLPLNEVTISTPTPCRTSPEGCASPTTNRRQSPEGKRSNDSPKAIPRHQLPAFVPLRRQSPSPSPHRCQTPQRHQSPSPARLRCESPAPPRHRHQSPADQTANEDASGGVRPKQRPYGGQAAAQPPIPKKTPGQRLKEKFLLPSRKGAVRKPPGAGVVASVGGVDSGLGSSPNVTTPTSLRHPITNTERNALLLSHTISSTLWRYH